MNEKTVWLFHKADWIDINFAIRSTMTKTITEDEIDKYVDTLTNTITSAIAEKVPTKTIKRNSIGLPIEIRELIRQKRHQRRLRCTRQTLTVYRNELARTLQPHIQGNCDQLWCSPRKPYQPSSLPSLHV